MPRLIAEFRARPRGHAPADRLLPDELSRVVRGVRRLSGGLTRGRRLVGAAYLDDAELRAAYLLYFWPVSYAQARHVLSELGTRPRAVLDLGSGPGPFALAAFDAGAAEVTAGDRSEAALEAARRLAAGVRRSLVTRGWDPLRGVGLPGGGQAWSVISLGHVLNELWSGAPDRLERRTALCTEALGRLRRGGTLVLVEPALRDTSRELLQVRDRLVDAGFPLRAPCLWRGRCPALAHAGDWCHGERAWEPPPALAQIIAAAGLHKEALKTACVAVSRAGEPWPEPPPGRLFRVVSEPMPSHGRTRVMGCGAEGRIPLARADAAVSETNRAFGEARRGDVLAVEDAETTETGGVRVAAETRVRIALRAGEALREPSRASSTAGSSSAPELPS